MNLRELLSELRCNILADVSTRVGDTDEAPPGNEERILNDASLVRYINDAERRFARRTRCLVDSTSDASILQLRPGKGTYELDARIIDVRELRVENRQLRRTTRQATYPYPDTSGVAAIMHGEGTPQAFWFEDDSRSLTIHPTPSDRFGMLAHMRIVRLPMRPLSLLSMDQSPEVPEDYHLDLLEWAAFRAFRNNDVDFGETNYIQRANTHRARFNDAIAEYQRDAKIRNPPQFALNGRH